MNSKFLDISDHCIYRQESPGQISIIHLETNTFYRISNVAAYLWLRIDGTRSAEQVIQDAQKKLALKKSFVPMLRSFLNELIETGLIEETTKKRSSARKPQSQIDIATSAIRKNPVPPVLEKRDHLSAVYLVAAASSC